ncbi:MAG: polysaccharide deacetylase family protein [Ruminococcus sp.]|nr:polysaccharide deacetylase family protein [Ruminococcus sp.]
MYKTIKLGKAECLGATLALAAVGALLIGAVVRAEAAEAIEEGSRELPVIMYHSVVGDPSLVGDYVVTADELEADLRYLSENGMTAVTCGELVRFVDGEGDLPERPVVLSFDDGCYNNFYYALPLLEKYDMKAVFAPVTSWTEQAASEEAPSRVYSYMDADNLKTCFLSGRVEIADHTYSLHDLSRRRGVLRKPGESEGDYRRMLWSDLDRSRRIIGAVTGEPPITLVYPYGFCSDETEELVTELGYRVTFGCEERVNIVSVGDYGCLSRLGRFNRASGRTAEQMIGK